jgi:hypothetical protein
MTQPNALAHLAASGVPLDSIPESQKAVLVGLSDTEIGILTSIKTRLDAAAPDVQALSEGSGGTFW